MKPILLLCLMAINLILNAQAKYNLNVEINTKDSIASGSQTINWKSPATLDSIALVFGSNFKGKGLIENPTINGEPAKLIASDDKHKYWLIPKKNIEEGKAITVRLNFKTDTLKDFNGFGYIPIADDWHPTISQFREGRFYWDEEALKDYDLKFEFPSNYKAAITGRLISQNASGATIIIHSAIANVTNFGICLSDKFLVSEGEAAGVKITSYYFDHDATWGKKLLEMSKDIISFYKSEIGFFPQPVLSILPGWNQPAGGYPIASNMYVIHRNLDLKGEAFGRWIMSHEIGHTYWGFGYVLEEGAYPAWFGLSMGIYTDWLYHKAKNYDLSVYEFSNRYMAGVLNGVNTTVLQPLDSLKKANFDYNNIISHGKSFTILQILSDLIGVETFNNVFRESLKRFKGKTVTLQMFQDLTEEISKKDLDWFFGQWYKTNDYLDYRISNTLLKREGKDFVQQVKLSRFGNAVMPVELRMERYNDAPLNFRLDGNFRDTTVIIRTNTTPKNIILDPEKKLPLLTHTNNDILTLITAANYRFGRNDPEGVLRLLEPNKQLGEASAGFHYFLGRAYRKTGQYQKAIETLEKGTQKSDRRDYQLLCLLETGRAYDVIGMRQKAIEYYQKALQEPFIKTAANNHLKIPYTDR